MSGKRNVFQFPDWPMNPVEEAKAMTAAMFDMKVKQQNLGKVKTFKNHRPNTILQMTSTCHQVKTGQIPQTVKLVRRNMSKILKFFLHILVQSTRFLQAEVFAKLSWACSITVS